MGPGIYNLFKEEILESEKKGRKEGQEEGRELVLKDMVSLGMITQDQANEYRNSRLTSQ